MRQAPICHVISVLRVLGIVSALLVSISFSPDSKAAGEVRKRKPTIDDLIGMMSSVVAGADVSEDGKWIAYQLEGSNLHEDLDKPIYARPLYGKGNPLRVDNGLSPKWSPDGSALAYYASKGTGRQLWIYDRQRGTTHELTNLPDGIIESDQARYNGYTSDAYRFSWSPNGHLIVFPTYKATDKPADGSMAGTPAVLDSRSSETDELRGIFNAVGHGNEQVAGTELGRRGSPELIVANVHTGALKVVVDSSIGCFNPAWSPNGQQVACVSTAGAPIGSHVNYSPSQLLLVDAETFSRKELTSLTDKIVKMPAWSPNGEQIAYLEGDTHLERLQPHVIDIQLGTTRAFEVTSGWPVHSVRWNKDGRALLVGDGQAIYKLDLTTSSGNVRNLLKPNASYVIETAINAVTSQFVVYVDQAGERPAAVWSVNPRTGQTNKLFDIGPATSQFLLGKHVLVKWRNSRGEDLEGVLILPVGHRAGQHFPLIVDVYPGLAKNAKESEFSVMGGNEVLAANGYGVFFPAWRAPHVWMNSIRSQEFSDAAKGPSGWDVTYDDIMTGVEQVVSQYGVDPRRMCLFGFSNGGLIADYLITQTDRFACAVSVSAVPPDWLAPFFIYSEFDIQHALDLPKSPFDDPQSYIAMSPIYRLKNVSTPVLLAAGDNEWSGVLTTLEMYVGLKRLGKDVTFLRYPNQGHGFVGAAARDFWSRYNSFFATYLFPDRQAQVSAVYRAPAARASGQ